jgi:choline dehydrogenase-like flavoprotein
MICHLDLAIGSGELRLTSTDPTIQPLLDYRYLDGASDRRRLRDSVRLCVKLAKHESLRPLLGERTQPIDAEIQSDDALDDWLRREVSTGHHVSCTCKMGPVSDSMAVVDQFGKVHGVKGLRVADASIMPNCIRANTNVTTMMIGERVADFVRQDI